MIKITKEKFVVHLPTLPRYFVNNVFYINTLFMEIILFVLIIKFRMKIPIENTYA